MSSPDGKEFTEQDENAIMQVHAYLMVHRVVAGGQELHTIIGRALLGKGGARR